MLTAANPMKPKIGTFCGPKIGENSKHFNHNWRHSNTEFLTILARMCHLVVLWVWYSTLISGFMKMALSSDEQCGLADIFWWWWTITYYLEMINDFIKQFLHAWTLYNFVYEWQSSVCIERQSTSQLSRLASNYSGLHQKTRRSINHVHRDVTTCQTTCRFDHTTPPDAYGDAISENIPLHLRMTMSSAVNHPSPSQSTLQWQDSILWLFHLRGLLPFVARNISYVKCWCKSWVLSKNRIRVILASNSGSFRENRESWQPCVLRPVHDNSTRTLTPSAWHLQWHLQSVLHPNRISIGSAIFAGQ